MPAPSPRIRLGAGPAEPLPGRPPRAGTEHFLDREELDPGPAGPRTGLPLGSVDRAGLAAVHERRRRPVQQPVQLPGSDGRLRQALLLGVVEQAPDRLGGVRAVATDTAGRTALDPAG